MQDPLLIQIEGKHQGHLAFPYSSGVVFSHITRKQFESQAGLQQLFPANLVICQDEFYESVDPLDLQQRLWDCCGYAFGEPLTPTQIDRIRWHLFPEICMLTASASLEEDAPILVKPQSAGRHGPKPELIRLPSFKREVEYLIDRVQQFQQQGIAWNQIAIVYRDRFMGNQICQQLKAAQVPVEWVNETQNSRNFQPSESSIKLITMHSSKGLEFPVVLIPGIGFMPMPNRSAEQEARLLYVAMTRAIEQLVMTGDRPSTFTCRLASALQDCKP